MLIKMEICRPSIILLGIPALLGYETNRFIKLDTNREESDNLSDRRLLGSHRSTLGPTMRPCEGMIFHHITMELGF